MLHHGLRVHCWLTPSRRYACSPSCLRGAVGSRASSTNSKLHSNIERAQRPRIAWVGQQPPQNVLRRSPKESTAIWNSIRHTAFGDWSSAARTLHEAITSGRLDAASCLESSIATNTVSLETIRACLDAEMTRITKLPRRARPAVFRKERKQLARSVLHYIWNDTILWLPLMANDRKAAMQLCYLLLAEKAEGLIDQFWMRPLPEESLAWAYDDPLLISCMMSPRSAVSAIKSYLRLEKFAEDAKRRFYDEQRLAPDKPFPAVARISLAPALMTLKARFITGDYSRTSPQLWDLAVSRIARLVSFDESTKPIATHFSLAALSLNHPTTPAATEALTFLDKYFLDSPKGDPKEIRDALPASERVLCLFLSKASSIAHKDGQEQVAARVAALKTELLLSAPNRAR
ncbi:hypothetical protein CB0940_05806 [Cercospora beticola]|uniref:Uncharacterized protein n=1 Tax=Cercospora beticola TaxID=122368 RepID=A0A2G5HY13_CERBT|nr:hypothetical protein CB0940_05806 [Cercospora beticola]PIA97435.1 hypothetical protein CB0940_05806 [Cercospora beticola]CAK1359636.1 unnamed protein product [Cercospora beticola]